MPPSPPKRKTVNKPAKEGFRVSVPADEARSLLEVLELRGLRFALAESCTGGLVSAAVTAVPGASRCFWGGVVSYANEAKETILRVPGETLREHGAVSPQTVRAMAREALRISGADLAAAVSGIAGPGGGTPEKPVGTVWIGLASGNGAAREELLSLAGDRSQIREQAAARVLIALRRFAEEQKKDLP